MDNHPSRWRVLRPLVSLLEDRDHPIASHQLGGAEFPPGSYLPETPAQRWGMRCNPEFSGRPHTQRNGGKGQPRLEICKSTRYKRKAENLIMCGFSKDGVIPALFRRG